MDLWTTQGVAHRAHSRHNHRRRERNVNCVTHVVGQTCHPCRRLRTGRSACAAVGQVDKRPHGGGFRPVRQPRQAQAVPRQPSQGRRRRQRSDHPEAVSVPPFRRRDALQRQERRQVGPLEPRVRHRRERRLGVVGDPEPRGRAPCRGRWPRRRPPAPSAAPIPAAAASSRSAASLASRPRIGRATSPVSTPVGDEQRVRLVAREPRLGRHPLGEEAEPARDQRRLGPERRHGPHQRPRPRVQPHPLGVAALEDAPPAAPSAAPPARSAPPRSRARPASPPR